MTVTRKYYEELLDIFAELIEAGQEGVLQYFDIKKRMYDLLDKINRYHLLKINLSEEFYSTLLSKSEENIISEKNNLIIELYTRLLNTSIQRNYFNPDEPNYLKSVEINLVNLGFDDYCKIHEEVHSNLIDSQTFQLHSSRFPSFKQVTEADGFKSYKNELTSDKQPIRNKSTLKKLEGEYIDIVKNYFETKIKEYKAYIFENYPSLISEFKYYNNQIRIYFSRFRDSGGTMRIYIYPNTNYNSQVVVYPYDVDFYGSEFENIEELDTPIVGGLETYVRLDEDFGNRYDRFLSIRDIHHELLDIFIRNASKEELNRFIIFLLKTAGYNFNPFKEIDKKGFDYAAVREDEIFHFQVLTQELKNINKLKELIKNKEVENLIFVSAYRVFHSISKQLEKENIKLKSLHGLAFEHFNNENGILIHWYIKSKLKDLTIQNTDSVKQGDILIKKLEDCKLGLEGWRDYELICTEIFEFLFSNSFRKLTHKTQSYEHDGIFRRDLIVNNNFTDATSFWSQIKSDFNSNIIVIDFKNYGEPLDQNEMYLPTKYLNIKSGNFILLFTRKGVDDSASKLQRKLLEDGKLIIPLTDVEVIDMIREKMIGEDVNYVLENKRFLLFEKI
ncbi:conserved protein of unknown function [Tenacibaculum sp. 190524A02b]|uniref:hypothetical protein n=1 Tax=Tenacibaculum vairaonense TaxID=3137860 RepID=UPI0032B2FA1C